MDAMTCLFQRRSCRRFKQDPIPRADLERMIDAGRYAPTGYNRQSIRFAIIDSPAKVAQAFEFTGWLTGAPPQGQRPAAYIVVLCDGQVGVDRTGAATASYAVMLAAWAMGYGSCWHGREGNEKFKAFLGLPDHHEPQVLISLGRPDEPFEVHDGSEDWKVRKADDGTVHLGKFSRRYVTVGVL